MADHHNTHISDSPSPPAHDDIEKTPRDRKLSQEIVYSDEQEVDAVNRQHAPLHTKLKSRHMQMIAIGEYRNLDSFSGID